MKESLYKSLALHVVVFLLIIIDLPFSWFHKPVISQVPIIVDLNQVKISEMTNLPAKAKFGKEDKKASTIKRKVEEKYTQEDKKAPPVPDNKPVKKEVKEPAKEEAAPTPPKKDFLVAPQPKKPAVPKQKTEKTKPAPKPEAPKKAAKPQDKKAPTLANPLKSLLASVDALEKNLGEIDEEATIKEGTTVNNTGIEGGVGGSYFSELSISETDAIAGRLRACWNLDPGAMGIQDMIVSIRVLLGSDGAIREVKILDNDRYNSDAHFRSVADSARRAVYICSDVYKIFPEKYADRYDMWKEMLLRFNPMSGQIM